MDDGQRASAPQLTFDPTNRMYFYRDSRSDELVYQDGSRIPATPRTTPGMLSSPYHPRQRSSQPSYPSSPSQRQNYAHNHAQSPPLGQPRGRADISGIMSELSIYSPGSQSTTYQSDRGIQIIETTDPQSQVRTRMGIAPADRITDPALFSSGISAVSILYGAGDGNDVERLYSNYRVRKHDFFTVGTVFMVLWAEPTEPSSGSIVTNIEASDGSLASNAINERVYSKVRRFVIIREGNNYCSALPVVTYGGQGVGKQRVIKSEHAIIYTGRNAPTALPMESPGRGEEGMRPIPIRVIPDEPTSALDPMSRLDFGKVHTIQHSIKVRPFGRVHPDALALLQMHFTSVWTKTPSPGQALLQRDHRAPPMGQTSTQTTYNADTQASSARASRSTGAAQRQASAADPLNAASRKNIKLDSDDDYDDDDGDDESDDDIEENESDGSGDDHNASSSVARLSRNGQASSTKAQKNYLGQSGRPGSVASSISASTARPFPSSTSLQPRAASATSSGLQGSQSARVLQARADFTRFMDMGYSREGAFTLLVNSYQRQQGNSGRDPHAEVRALLLGKP